MTPAGKPEIIWDPVTRREAPQRKFFIPSVDTKGWGRWSLVSRVPLIRPTIVPAIRAIRIRTTGLVMPPLTSIPQMQAQNVALAPTERSIPAVIRQSSIPVERSAVKVVCFRTDMILL